MARHDPPILSQAADSRSDGALGTDGTPSPSAATARVETGRPFRVAVVIPLGLDRGIGVDCIRGWALEQDLPRERYQLLLGAPPDLDAKKREQIQRMLAPWDVMVALHDSHDMRLVEHAAGRADADLLLFSESHCIPQPDAVSYLVEQIDGHPDWAALSAPTRALADNPLAEIERDVYSRDIHGKLSHDWLRVLDQCFLIRREAYDLTGGFRGAYGHFAEWLLAAAMRLRGLRIGVAERAVVSHKYIGDYDELERFTTDFAYGQIKYLHECRHEPAASLSGGDINQFFRCPGKIGLHQPQIGQRIVLMGIKAC